MSLVGFSRKEKDKLYNEKYAKFKACGMTDDEAYVLAAHCVDPRTIIVCCDRLGISEEEGIRLYNSGVKKLHDSGDVCFNFI